MLIKWGLNLPWCANEVLLKAILETLWASCIAYAWNSHLIKSKFLQNEAHIHFNIIWYLWTRISHYQFTGPAFFILFSSIPTLRMLNRKKVPYKLFWVLSGPTQESQKCRHSFPSVVSSVTPPERPGWLFIQTGGALPPLEIDQQLPNA